MVNSLPACLAEAIKFGVISRVFARHITDSRVKNEVEASLDSYTGEKMVGKKLDMCFNTAQLPSVPTMMCTWPAGELFSSFTGTRCPLLRRAGETNFACGCIFAELCQGPIKKNSDCKAVNSLGWQLNREIRRSSLSNLLDVYVRRQRISERNVVAQNVQRGLRSSLKRPIASELARASIIRPYVYRIGGVGASTVKVSSVNVTEEYLIPRVYTRLNQHGVP